MLLLVTLGIDRYAAAVPRVTAALKETNMFTDFNLTYTQPESDFGQAMCWFFLLHLHPSLLSLSFTSISPLYRDLLFFSSCVHCTCFLLLVLSSVSSLPSLSVLVLSTLAAYSPRKHPIHFHSSGIQPDVYAIFSPHACVPQPRCALTSDTPHAPAQALSFSICHVSWVGLPPRPAALCHCPQATTGGRASCTHTYAPSGQVLRLVVL